MAEETCANCKFFRFAVMDDGATDLKTRQCKRDAPKIFAVPGPQGVAFAAIRPGPNPNDWCGEWKPRAIN